MDETSFTFVDLFAGLGCFHLAAAELGGRCVFACEVNEQLRDLYKANFLMSPSGDIRKVKTRDVPDHDLLCAGFPCQPFSKAGRQLGLDDSVRGTVIYDVFRIIRAKKPEFIILENIAHFVNHDDGKTYAHIQAKLEKLGYAVRVGKLSPHQFGVPQIRERMYLVARKGRRSLLQFRFPEAETTSDELSLLTILDPKPEAARGLSEPVTQCLTVWQEFLNSFPRDEDLPGTPIWSMEFGATYPYDKGSLKRMPARELSKYKGAFGCSLAGLTRAQILAALPSHARNGPFPDWKRDRIQKNRDFYKKHKKWLDRWLPKIQQFPSSYQKLEWHCKGEVKDIWRYVIRFRASGVRVKRPTTAPSLIAMTPVQIPIIGWQKRYMTIEECARLQSIDGLKALPEDTAFAAHALGNAVNVRVVKLILDKLFQS